MIAYLLIVGFLGVCSSLLFIVLGNILKNAESLFALLGKDIQKEELSAHRSKIIPLMQNLGNLFILLGIGSLLWVAYTTLFMGIFRFF